MLKTAECVTPMHPDKMCDRISDSILDLCLSQDPSSRVAVETLGGHGKVYVVGEITTNAIIGNHAIENIVRQITGDNPEIEIRISKQSPEIANGVDTGGAGDQGIMIGYACRDNEAMIPQELYLARSLAKFIYGRYPYDGKTQITIDDFGVIKTVVASFCYVPKEELAEMINKWLSSQSHHFDIKIHVNPAGDWNQGGFDADTGLTGRKLAVDNYGTRIPLGGGAFSGKDSTKVDRSGAYIARRLAVDILRANKEYKDVTVEIAYSIGVAEPVMAVFHARVTDDFVVHTIIGKSYLEHINSVPDLTPKGIIDYLKLREPKFAKTAEWGHFGNGFEWDK